MNDVPDPKVSERARRRTCTAKDKRDLLAEYEACDRVGKAALLRREDLYSSVISVWCDQREAGALHALVVSSGPAPTDPAAREAPRLHTEDQRLAAGPGKFKTVIEVQDKLSALLDTLGSGGNGNDSQQPAVSDAAITERIPVVGI